MHIDNRAYQSTNMIFHEIYNAIRLSPSYYFIKKYVGAKKRIPFFSISPRNILKASHFRNISGIKNGKRDREMG